MSSVRSGAGGLPCERIASRSVREGRERIWELEPERVEEARRCLDAISSQWDAALGRLRALVER